MEKSRGAAWRRQSAAISANQAVSLAFNEEAGRVKPGKGRENEGESEGGCLAENHIKTIYIEPASPWQNGFVESFHGRFRDECLNREQLWTLTEARVVIGNYRCEYNQHRPHSRLGYLSPARFAAQLSPSPAPVGLRPPSAGDGQNQNHKLA